MYWAPQAEDSEPWVAVDLERLVKVRQVRLEFPTAGRYGFVVEASRDRTDWTVIADQSRTGTSTSRIWHLDVPEIVTLQVRVRLLPTDGPPSGAGASVTRADAGRPVPQPLSGVADDPAAQYPGDQLLKV
ncbi:discoidin domain-containing protein [Nonomuraea sp. NPDC003201]